MPVVGDQILPQNKLMEFPVPTSQLPNTPGRGNAFPTSAGPTPVRPSNPGDAIRCGSEACNIRSVLNSSSLGKRLRGTVKFKPSLGDRYAGLTPSRRR